MNYIHYYIHYYTIIIVDIVVIYDTMYICLSI